MFNMQNVGIAPFLDRGFLGELARDTIKREGINAIGGIAPFLDRDIRKLRGHSS